MYSSFFTAASALLNQCRCACGHQYTPWSKTRVMNGI